MPGNADLGVARTPEVTTAVLEQRGGQAAVGIAGQVEELGPDQPEDVAPWLTVARVLDEHGQGLLIGARGPSSAVVRIGKSLARDMFSGQTTKRGSRRPARYTSILALSQLRSAKRAFSRFSQRSRWAATFSSQMHFSRR